MYIVHYTYNTILRIICSWGVDLPHVRVLNEVIICTTQNTYRKTHIRHTHTKHDTRNTTHEHANATRKHNTHLTRHYTIHKRHANNTRTRHANTRHAAHIPCRTRIRTSACHQRNIVHASIARGRHVH